LRFIVALITDNVLNGDLQMSRASKASDAKPEKSFEVLFARVDPPTANAVKAAAQADARTVSGLIRMIIRDWLDRQPPAKQREASAA
jgi:hypothetical protein